MSYLPVGRGVPGASTAHAGLRRLAPFGRSRHFTFGLAARGLFDVSQPKQQSIIGQGLGPWTESMLAQLLDADQSPQVLGGLTEAGRPGRRPWPGPRRSGRS